MLCPHSGIHTAMEMKEIQTHKSAKMICAKCLQPSPKKKMQVTEECTQVILCKYLSVDGGSTVC